MARATFDGVNLVARDVEKTLEFYRRLGVEIPEESVWKTDTGAHHVGAKFSGEFDLDVDSPELAKVYNAGFQGSDPRAGHTVIGFRLPSREAVDACYADLTGSGAKGLQPPWDAFWGARYAILEDPDGRHVGIMSPSDPERRSAPPSI